MDFGYSGNFKLTKEDEKEILKRVHNGLTVKEAVQDWTCGLTDFDYQIVENFVDNRIIEYVESIQEEW